MDVPHQTPNFEYVGFYIFIFGIYLIINCSLLLILAHLILHIHQIKLKLNV